MSLHAQTETDRVNAPVSDVGLNKTEHLLGGLGHLDEHTIVDLKKTEELKDFAGLGCDVVDTAASSVPVENIQLGHNTHPRIRMTK